ncbi:hypothetical protein G6F35_018924 [Rhizopus arrhizus]|nr:hypothetical protein G6F35_018924 [Rhizopus arrhizus]
MGVSDHIVAIDAGRELAQGNPAQIQQSPAVRQAYLGDEAARRAPAARQRPAGAPIAPEVLGVGNLCGRARWWPCWAPTARANRR